MNMHSDTKWDYQRFLQNMEIERYDGRSEYDIARVLMAGRTDCIAEIVESMESDDFYDAGIQKIFETVKGDYLAGNTFEGSEQFSHITTTYFDIFNGKNLPLNPSFAGSVMDFMNTKAVPEEKKMRMCMASVKNKRLLRDTLFGLYTAADMCVHDGMGIEKAYSYLTEMLWNRETRRSEDGDIEIDEFADLITDTLVEFSKKKVREKRTINLGWRKFQRCVGGLGIEELCIVSARSGDGKSAFALNVAADVGVLQKIPVLYINSELSNEQMAMRYTSYAAHLDSRKIRGGEYAENENIDQRVFNKVMLASKVYRKGALKFKRIPDLQIANIERAIRSDCMKRGTKLVIVDYLGRMDITKTSGVKDLQEWQIMRLAANRLKTLAQKYETCVIMCCQLTDQGTLQGSKAMKNECDMWLSINRLKENDDIFKNKRLIDIFPYNTFIDIEKARNVSDATSMLFRYEGAMMRFCDSEEKIKDMIDENKKYGNYASQLMSDEEYNLLKGRINSNAFVRGFQ